MEYISKKTFSFLFLLLILFISYVYSAEKAPTLTLSAEIFDQFPAYNKNFEPDNGDLTQYIVKANLGADKIPQLNFMDASMQVNKNGRIYYPELFQWFFQSNPVPSGPINCVNCGYNKAVPYDLILTYNPQTDSYVYNNQYFFPIDNQGFDTNSSYRIYKDDAKKYHNYHFCLKASSKFTYQGGEQFDFTGDDDVWVFIDSKLVVDLGGLHVAESKSLKLDSLGLEKSKTYSFDFYYCERHTTKSTIKISNSIEFFCPKADYCGVCGGNGSTCCNPSTDCNDNNACTVDYCPSADTDLGGLPVKAFCRSIPIIDKDAADKCHIRSCNNKTGEFYNVKDVECEDRSSTCQVKTGCDYNVGCKYESTCKGKCDTLACDKGVCVKKDSTACVNELEPTKVADICYIYECTENGCQKTQKCPPSTNPCKINSCDAKTGECKTEDAGGTCCQADCTADKVNKCQLGVCDIGTGKCHGVNKTIDDGNKCTIDSCDLTSGDIKHEPVVCGGCSVCSPSTGLCAPSNEKCDDGNQCSDDKCTLTTATNGVCSSTATTKCDLGDKCKVYTCDIIGGCNSTDLVCPDKGRCQVGYCDKTLGCQLKPRECKSDIFCLVSECDEKFGCITYDRRCAADNRKCQEGICINGTKTEQGRCVSKDYDPKPFICKTAAVVSTAVAAGIAVAGAVALAAAIFAGKKGYDYWKESSNNTITSANANPLYEANPSGGENPLYNNQS